MFGVGQINSMNKEELSEIKEMLIPHLPQVLEGGKMEMIYFMLTDILNPCVFALYGVLAHPSDRDFGAFTRYPPRTYSVS